MRGLYMNILYLYCMFILFIGQSLVPKQPVVIDQSTNL